MGYSPRVSLAKLVQKYLGLDIEASKKGEDSWRLRYGTLDTTPIEKWPSEARKYALDDARRTYQVFMAQGGPEKAWPTEHLQVQADLVLKAIGVWGIMVNQEKHAVLKTRQQALVAELEKKVAAQGWIGEGSKAKLAEAVKVANAYRCAKVLADSANFAGVVIDWDAWRRLVHQEGVCDMKAYMEGCVKNNYLPAFIPAPPENVNMVQWCDQTSLMMPQIAMTTGGEKKKPSIAVSEEILSDYFDVCPDFKTLVDYKHEQKMLATYVEAYDVLVTHGSYSTLVSTGRTSCSPGHQTIPKPDSRVPGSEAYREQFCPRPGHVYGIVDYSALELCTCSNDPS
jgi:hypothetical protein